MIFGIEDSVFGFCSQVDGRAGGVWNVREGAHKTTESQPLVRQERYNNMSP